MSPALKRHLEFQIKNFQMRLEMQISWKDFWKQIKGERRSYAYKKHTTKVCLREIELLKVVYCVFGGEEKQKVENDLIQ